MKKPNNKHLRNAANERIKYKYRIHVARTSSKDEKTIIIILKHLRHFESFIDFQDFRIFKDVVADKYIKHMINYGSKMSFISDNIRALKEFLRWLERQRGYKAKINYNHIDYLNISNNQKRIAKAAEYKKSYNYEQIFKAIRTMPEQSIVQQRNKAIISLQALCGLRISELRTIKIKSLISEEGKYFIYLNPKDMEIKFAKTRNANFLNLPNDILQNFLNWFEYLKSKGFKDKDPLFPQVDSKFNQLNLLEPKITKIGIKSNTTIINAFKKAFESAGLDYLRPHSFRHTIVRYAERQSPEYLNAVRQSLGHSSIDTTFQSYGQLSTDEQRNRISNLDFAGNKQD